MSIVRSMTRPSAGMGAVIMRGMGASNWHPEGTNITPQNFQEVCCPFSTWYGDCAKVKAANESLFSPCFWGACSDCAKQNLAYGSLADRVVPPLPAGWDAATAQVINPCTGLPVITAQDIDDLTTCQARLASEQQTKENVVTAGDILSAQCELAKEECAARPFGAFLSPNANCSDCYFDWTKGNTLLLMAGGVGLLIGGLLLVKLLK